MQTAHGAKADDETDAEGLQGADVRLVADFMWGQRVSCAMPVNEDEMRGACGHR